MAGQPRRHLCHLCAIYGERVNALGRGRLLTQNQQVSLVITGSLLPEPVEVLARIPLGDSVKLIGNVCKTGLVRVPDFTPAQLT